MKEPPPKIGPPTLVGACRYPERLTERARRFLEWNQDHTVVKIVAFARNGRVLPADYAPRASKARFFALSGDHRTLTRRDLESLSAAQAPGLWVAA